MCTAHSLPNEGFLHRDPQSETPKTETLLDRDQPGQRLPCGQTDADENITLPQTSPEVRNRDVLIFLNFPHFSPERTQTWSLGATESEVWIGNFYVKVKKKKKYRAQTPQNLALTKNLQNFNKTSTPPWRWWGYSNLNLCKRICLNFLHSLVGGCKNYRSEHLQHCGIFPNLQIMSTTMSISSDSKWNLMKSCLSLNRHVMQWQIQGGARDTHPTRGPNSFIFMQFSAK